MTFLTLIAKFVEYDNAFTDFHYACLMLVNTLTRPVPRTAAVIAWMKKQSNVRML